MAISAQNTRLDYLGADLRPPASQRSPSALTAPVAAPVLPTLSALGVLDLARLWRDDPTSALHLADSNAREHWDDVASQRASSALTAHSNDRCSDLIGLAGELGVTTDWLLKGGEIES